MPSGRPRAQAVLAECDKVAGLHNAERIFGAWERQSFSAPYLSVAQISFAGHETLLTSFLRDLEPFDCFVIGRWRPSENQLSDVVGALFDPAWGHAYAVPILIQAMQVLKNDQASKPKIREVVDRISRSLLAGSGPIAVRREVQGTESRADIDIFRRGPHGFLVRIEHKIRGGTETFARRKH